MPQLIVFILGFLAGAAAAGQGRTQSSTMVSITVIDSLTLLPIADVHVATSEGGDISGAKGELAFRLSDGDILYATHINYLPKKVIFRMKAMGTHFIISMKPNVRLLREIQVTDVLSEEAMKKKLLETQPEKSAKESVAAENSKIINSLRSVAPTAPPTREEQFFQSLQGRKDVTILSSKGGGLIKAIKNIANPAKLEIADPKSEYHSDPSKITPFKVKLKPVDSLNLKSVKPDSLLVRDSE